ncbi:Dyp-type peroxidase [Glycomyces buryatensis]|uniref:Dyp-type peroxidase n=1 Tax=Glycomyces buryatensis TaxID=2570927 RepID=A0A4S8Q3A7_9ACTN|nr:Dyp-type peroxidase [Glycomyces buryatensis]THV34654.1 Dyp-type peroxidase [Glycomyces buryatensis]
MPAALKQLALRLHFYAGILIAPFLLVSALTGLAYALSYQVENIVYDDLYTVEDSGGTALPLNQQIEAATAAHPDWTVTGVRPADAAEDTTGVLMDDGVARESGAVPIVFVDPYTGEVRGDSTTYGSSHAGPIREWISTLHRHLHLGEPGRVYSELAASWLWVVILGGLVLWVVRRKRQGGGLWPRSGGEPSRAKTLNWHAPVGLWLAGLLLFLSVTGLTWSTYAGANISELREQVSWTTPSISADAGEHAGHEGHVHSTGVSAFDLALIQDVYETAVDADMEGPLEITFPTGDGGEFLISEEQRAFPIQQDTMTITTADGVPAVHDSLRFADWPFMAQVTKVVIALHMGLFFGLVNQLLLAAAMVALIFMIGWGYRMWWQRRPKGAAVGRPYPRGSLRRLPWPLLAVAVPVVAVIGWFLPLFGIPLLAFLAVDALIGLWQRKRPATDESDSSGVSRRTALGAATVTAALGAGVGYTLGQNHEHEDEAGHEHGTETEPFYGDRQAGIATPAQGHAMFTAFDLAEDITAERLQTLMSDWSAAAAAMAVGKAAPKRNGDSDEHFDAEAVSVGLNPARLTVTFGLGPGAFAKTSLDSRQPSKLVELPEFDGDQLNPTWSGGDLLVQICGDDQQVVSGAFLELRKRAVGAATLRWVQQGFMSGPADGGTPRNLQGFKDGSLNPELGSDDFDQRVWATESEPDWFEGGTYLVFRKIRMKMPAWSAATAEEQNLTIGKDRDSGAPLSGGGEFDHPDFEAVDDSGLPAIPADSHVALTHEAKMFRRGYNYDYGFLTQGDVSSDAVDHDHAAGTADHGHDEHPYDAGLLFASFQSDPQVFIDTQEKMAGGDRLMEFIVAEGSAVFAVPPGAAEGGFVAEGLFDQA